MWQGQQSDWRRRPGQMRDGQRQQGSDESVNTRACRFATRQRQWQPCRRRILCSAMCSCLPARMLEHLGAQQDSSHLHQSALKAAQMCNALPNTSLTAGLTRRMQERPHERHLPTCAAGTSSAVGKGRPPAPDPACKLPCSDLPMKALCQWQTWCLPQSRAGMHLASPVFAHGQSSSPVVSKVGHMGAASQVAQIPHPHDPSIIPRGQDVSCQPGPGDDVYIRL